MEQVLLFPSSTTPSSLFVWQLLISETLFFVGEVLWWGFLQNCKFIAFTICLHHKFKKRQAIPPTRSVVFRFPWNNLFTIVWKWLKWVTKWGKKYPCRVLFLSGSKVCWGGAILIDDAKYLLFLKVALFPNALIVMFSKSVTGASLLWHLGGLIEQDCPYFMN